MTLIHVGEGRHIKLDVEAVFRPPQPIIRKKRPRSVHSPETKRRTPKRKGSAQGLRPVIAKGPAWGLWWDYVNEVIGKYRDAGRKVGEVPGFRRSKMGYVMAHVRRKVQKDMENIKKVYTDLDETAEEALKGALEVLRGPQSQTIKLQAAKLLLEFTKSKPVAKSEVSVNAAEAWLDSISNSE